MRPGDTAVVLMWSVALVRHHNVATQAHYNYTVCQLDIFFFYLLSRICRDDITNEKYTISVKDVEALTGWQWNYQQLHSTLKLSSKYAKRIYQLVS